MCIYTHFQYLCLHEKTKIQTACDNVVIDRHGNLTCLNETDGTQRTFGHRTYGVGICSSIHCAWNFSILPIGDYGNDTKFGNSLSFEDDTEIDDSPEAREERVARWYRLLSTEQQLDHLRTEYPVPINERSIAGRDLLACAWGPGVVPTLTTMRWQELNPLFLTPAMLQWCIFNRVLPASVADDRKSKTICPLKPVCGPFAIQAHKCSKKRGICKVCGNNIGDPALREKTMCHRQTTALGNLMREAFNEPDPIGTALDPFMDLKWDDDKGEYRMIPLNSGLQHCDPSRNPALGLPTTQTVDSAAVFNGPVEPLTDGSALASMELDTIIGSLGIDVNASYDDRNWFNLDFHSDPSSLPQVEFPADFSFDSQTPFGANLDTSINTGTSTPTQASDAGAIMHLQSGHNTEVANDTLMLDTTSDEHIFRDNSAEYDFSRPDPAVQAPQTFESTDDLMMTGDSSENDFDFDRRGASA